MVFALLGLCVAIGAAISDVYLHRGIETGAEQPYVVQPSGRELATNVDLTMFPPSDVNTVAAALQTNGFRYVRQSFSWADIEPTPGVFVWERYDAIVQALQAHGLQLVGVLHRSPDWARRPGSRGLADAPPDQMADYATFVGQVVQHYKGYEKDSKKAVPFIQLWDLPNRPDHWGGVAAGPASYLALLAEGFNAARTADPQTRIVLAELDPRQGDGSVGADLRFLQGIYDVRGQAFFDIVAARIDGGTSSPYDRTVQTRRANLSRAILFRELLVDHGDQAKPIWLTRYGWNGGAGGAVSRAEQADFLAAGIVRARAEWPWLGLMFAWDLMPRGDTGDAPGFALLNRDGTATGAFTALGRLGTSATAAATGFVPMDSRPVTYLGSWSDQHLNGQTFRTTSEIGATAILRFRGTGVIAYLRRSPQIKTISVTVDGKPVPGRPLVAGKSTINLAWYRAEDIPVRVASGLPDAMHELQVTLAGAGQLTVDGLVVSRDQPLLWPIVVLTGTAALLLALALRDLAYAVATRAGLLQRQRGVELRPPLPLLPDWQPARRI